MGEVQEEGREGQEKQNRIRLVWKAQERGKEQVARSGRGVRISLIKKER